MAVRKRTVESQSQKTLQSILGENEERLSNVEIGIQAVNTKLDALVEALKEDIIEETATLEEDGVVIEDILPLEEKTDFLAQMKSIVQPPMAAIDKARRTIKAALAGKTVIVNGKVKHEGVLDVFFDLNTNPRAEDKARTDTMKVTPDGDAVSSGQAVTAPVPQVSKVVPIIGIKARKVFLKDRDDGEFKAVTAKIITMNPLLIKTIEIEDAGEAEIPEPTTPGKVA